MSSRPFVLCETGSAKGSHITSRTHRHVANEKAAEIAKATDKPVAVWNAEALVYERTYFPSGRYVVGYEEVDPGPPPAKRRRPAENPDALHTPESAIMMQQLHDGHVHHEQEH